MSLSEGLNQWPGFAQTNLQVNCDISFASCRATSSAVGFRISSLLRDKYKDLWLYLIWRIATVPHTRERHWWTGVPVDYHSKWYQSKDIPLCIITLNIIIIKQYIKEKHKLISSCFVCVRFLFVCFSCRCLLAAEVVFLCFVALKWTKQELSSEIAAFDKKTSTNNKNVQIWKCGNKNYWDVNVRRKLKKKKHC